MAVSSDAAPHFREVSWPTTPDGRSTVRPARRRRILCVQPRYAPSFGTFQHAYPLFPKVTGFMPPQGILVVAAYLPAEWEVRFIDENRRPVRPRDFAWADAVLISGMHVQRGFIDDLNVRAHAHGKLTILGGPSVSACPDYYPDVDLLHVGELGDATDALIERLDSGVEQPDRQEIYATRSRTELRDFPVPAYSMIDIGNYFLASIQYSSGCPYLCEFCDIPALYGRNPRLKTPEQILRELDAILERGAMGAVYFVDDNFIANPRAARLLLPHLVRWQRERGYPVRFACESTLNIAGMPDLLAQMREANFQTVFVGIETPEPEALRAMKKSQNLRLPILEAVDTLNRHGMQVVSGIIMGLDTDHERTGEAISEFIRLSRIPLLTINLVYALPKTPLYDRLKAEARLLGDEESRTRVSNVRFRMPYDQVVGMWYETITRAYTPESLLERFRHQLTATFPNHVAVRSRVTAAQVRHGLGVMARILWRVGVRSTWRREFWRYSLPLLRRGKIEELINTVVMAHHLITFVEETRQGRYEAAFYADPSALLAPSLGPRRREGARDLSA